jgi:hypothetical protein
LNVDPDSENDAPIFLDLGFPVRHPPLDLGGADHRVHGAGELRQKSVPGGLDDPPPVFGDCGVDELLEVGSLTSERTLFVRLHEAGIAHHVHGENCSQPAIHAFVRPGVEGRRVFPAQPLRRDILACPTKGGKDEVTARPLDGRPIRAVPACQESTKRALDIKDEGT